MKKGEVKNVYRYTDQDIARLAGVKPSSYRVAKHKGTVNPDDLESVVRYVATHWLNKKQGNT